MARIAGVNIPDNKHVRVSLTYVYGVGNSLAASICDKLSIAQDTKVMDLSEQELESIRTELGNYLVEGDLRRDTSTNIKRLMDLGAIEALDIEEVCLSEDRKAKPMLEPEKALKANESLRKKYGCWKEKEN